jgi:hypothetical protein
MTLGPSPVGRSLVVADAMDLFRTSASLDVFCLLVRNKIESHAYVTRVWWSADGIISSRPRSRFELGPCRPRSTSTILNLPTR